MQILYAFVGYFAVTVLPFGPFAFASPLATIDHDGYVNTTEYHIDSGLTKQAPGIETQNQKDSVLLKHVSGDVIEARQAGIIIPVAFAIISIVAEVGGALWWIKKDDPAVRGNGVKFLVGHVD